MKIKSILILIIVFLPWVVDANGQGKSKEALFDSARELLAKREIDGAIIKLRKIYVDDRSNANVNFLMGAAYTELGGKFDRAIFHLKKALRQIDENYKVGDFTERSAPVHTFYYLTVALSSLDNCARAGAALDRLKRYDSMIDLYFIDEAERHMQKCPYEKIDQAFDEWLTEIQSPEGYDPLLLVEDSLVKTESDSLPLAELDSSRKAQLGVVTRELEYSTSAPLYGVQIGSNKHPSPISSYGTIKNVDVFVDKEGMIRYVVGHFSYRKQAEGLLKKLKEQGYEDAFVVNVNDERKYSNELISYGNVNLRSGIEGEVEYFVQLGAFQDSVPSHLMEMYLQVDGIREIRYQKLTLMAVGAYPTYEESLQKQKQLQEMPIEGIDEAFIVAFNRGKKISLQEAIDHTDE